MATHMKKYFFWIAAICFSLSGEESEIAKTSFPIRLTPEEEEEQYREPQAPEERSSCRSCAPVQTTPCCPPPCCKPPSLNCPPVTPRCDPCDCIIDYYNPLVFNGWDLSAEILIWTVQQKSSTFVLTPDNIHQPFPASDQSIADSLGKYKSAKFHWRPGFRVSLGYTFERDAWDFLGQYTFYGTSGNDTATRPSAPTLYLEPTSRAIEPSADGLNEIKSRTHFSYQVAELFLSRRFLPGCQILLNFFAGPTGAWISEKWKVTAVDSNVQTKTWNRWIFSGGGMRGGLDANWHFGSGFSFFNKLSFATLVGSYENRKKCQVTGGASTLLLPYIWDTKEEETWVVPTTQMEFGLNWGYRFCRWSLSLQAAFEVNTWYDLHQYHQASGVNPAPANQNKPDYRNASSVNLWGATVRANFSF